VARPGSNKPSIATYADHEVITPPHRLRRACATSAPMDSDPVERAEAALAKLGKHFAGWMDGECERLDQARQAAKAARFSRSSCEALFLAAHDIRGEAGTLGHALAASPADSLCRLIEHTPDPGRIPAALVDQHVDAVRAIVRETARPDIAEVAAQLTGRLRQVTDEFLARENRGLPAALAEVPAPALAPRDPAF
jgi:hypothetical protein